MISCRYVGGGCSELGEREFDTVGQRAMLSEEGFKEAVLGRAAFIAEADFAKVGFTEDELATHGNFGSRIDPPQSFCDKLATAQQFYRETFDRMLRESSLVLAEARGVDVQDFEATASR